ncbi:MAG: Ig-like domain-containing protein [Candidatus Zophobacter franzmannii]|nr:Ig-like domain-containing protein [Candidatus Zophobacter franzmannii]
MVIILLLLSACGSKDTLTGGPVDEVNPEILSVYPEELQDIGSGEIELVFSKDLDKVSVDRAIYIYPAVENLEVKIKKSTVKITFEPTLQEDTNYYLTINSNLKDVRNNSFEKPQTLTFKHGKLNTYKVRGVITYEDETLKGKPVSLSLLTSDSLLVMNTTLESDRFEIEYLNPADYLLRSYADVNDNTRYDFGKDLFYEGIFQQSERSARLYHALADSTLPKIRSGRFQYRTQLSLNLSEEISKFESIKITAKNDSITIPYTFAVINEKYLNLITEPVDTLTYKVSIEGMEDLKGNIREATAINVKGVTIRDTIPPTILSTEPEDGRTVKTLNPEITITFSEIIPKQYLGCNLYEIETGKEIKLTNLKGNNSTVIFMPIQKLRPYYSYRFVVNNSTADTAFNYMKEDYEIVFLPVAEQ